MNRRASVAAAMVVLVAALSARAQPHTRVGLVTTTPTFRDAFLDSLQRIGYQNGRNITIDWRSNPRGEVRDVEELVSLHPDCLVLAGPLNLAHGRRLTSTIPIVTIDLESDPGASGIVASLGRPGGSVTGIFLDLPELAGKQIQFLRAILPGLKRLAVMWQDPVALPQFRAAEAAALAAGIALVPIRQRRAAPY